MKSMKDRALVIAMVVVAALGVAVEVWMRNRGTESTFTDGETTVDDLTHRRTVLWGKPRGTFGPETTPDHESGVAIDSTGGRIVYCVGEPGSGTELWLAERRRDGWHRRHLIELSSPRDERSPCWSRDGRALYFASDRDGGHGGLDIYVADFAGGIFGDVVNVGVGVNSAGDDVDPALGLGDGMLLFASDRKKPGAGGLDLYFAERGSGPNVAAAEVAWRKPVALEGINTKAVECAPALGPDGRSLYFASSRSGGAGGLDLYKSVFLGETWLPPQPLTSLNTAADESDPSLSGEGFTLHFASEGDLRKSTSRELFAWSTERNRFLSPVGSIIAILLLMLMVVYAARRWAEMGILGRCVVTSLIVHLLMFLYFNRVMVHGSVRIGKPGEARYRVTMLRAKARERDQAAQKRRGDRVGPTEMAAAPTVTRADLAAPERATVSAPSLAASRVELDTPRVTANAARARAARRTPIQAAPVALQAPKQATRATRDQVAARARSAKQMSAIPERSRPVRNPREAGPAIANARESTNAPSLLRDHRAAVDRRADPIRRRENRANPAPPRAAMAKNEALAKPDRGARANRQAIAQAEAPKPLRSEQYERAATESAAPVTVPLGSVTQAPEAPALARGRRPSLTGRAAPEGAPTERVIAKKDAVADVGGVRAPARPGRAVRPAVAARERDVGKQAAVARQRTEADAPVTADAAGGDPDRPTEQSLVDRTWSAARVADTPAVARTDAAARSKVAQPVVGLGAPTKGARADRAAVEKAAAPAPKAGPAIDRAASPDVARAVGERRSREPQPTQVPLARASTPALSPSAVTGPVRPASERADLGRPAVDVAARVEAPAQRERALPEQNASRVEAPAIVAGERKKETAAAPDVTPRAIEPRARPGIAPLADRPLARRTALVAAGVPDRLPRRAPDRMPITAPDATPIARPVAPDAGPVAAPRQAVIAERTRNAPGRDPLERTSAAALSRTTRDLPRRSVEALAPRREPLSAPRFIPDPASRAPVAAIPSPMPVPVRQPIPDAAVAAVEMQPKPDKPDDPRIASSERAPIVARAERDAAPLPVPRRGGPGVKRRDAGSPDAFDRPDAPSLAISARLDERPRIDVTRATVAKVERVEGLYGHRTGEAKLRAVREFGGTEDSERAVARGLSYLARTQRTSGGWGRPRFRHHKYGQVQIGKSALALLAFLGSGHTQESGTRYSRTAARAIDYLLGAQLRSGHIGRGASYSHGIATYALAEAYAMTKDPTLREPLRLAVDRILDAQYLDETNRLTYGGWGYYYHNERVWDDWPRASVTAWQVMALKSATIGGIAVPDERLAAARSYLRNSFDRRAGSFRYSHDPDRLRSAYRTLPGSTPASIFALLLLGEDPSTNRVRAGLQFVMRRMPDRFERAPDMQFVLRAKGNLYFWYYSTLALFTLRGDDWSRWNARMRDLLVDSQSRDGSWRPISSYADYADDRHDDRTYTTALSVLMLEVYYRYVTPLLTYKPARAKPESSDRIRSPGFEGAFRVRRLDERGPAARAGVQVGDHLHRYAGQVITDVAMLRELIRENRRKRDVPLEVIRRGRVLRLRVAGGSLGVTVEDR